MAAITDRLGNRRLFLLTDPSQVMNMFVELFKIQVTELEMFQNPRLIAPTVLPRPFVDVFTRFHPKSGDRKGWWRRNHSLNYRNIYVYEREEQKPQRRIQSLNSVIYGKNFGFKESQLWPKNADEMTKPSPIRFSVITINGRPLRH